MESIAVRIKVTVAAVVCAVVVASCSGTDAEPEPTVTTATPEASPTPEPTSEPTPEPTFDPISLPAMFDEDISGADLIRTALLVDEGAYTRHTVTYRSGDLTISGVMNVPAGEGPFPAVVLNHGYIDPAVYVTGQGMAREQDYLARQGFVVLHTDYRGHATSNEVDELDLEFRLGYARDAIAAVKALRALPEVVADQVGMVGRSMGGGVTMNALVAEPGIVDAAVIYASVSSQYVDNYRMWTESTRPDRAAQIVDRWGSVEENPTFWADLSARTYFDRIESAVLIHHGTNDESCPYVWAEDTRDGLAQAGVDVEFHAYEGETHTFSRDWELSMQRTTDFLRAQLSS